MLTIRQAQLDAFVGERVADFERRMLVHLRRHFPHHVSSLGEENTLVVVRHAVACGFEAGVRAERDICKLTNLMIAFGPDLLDRPWAASSWQASAATPADRICRLYNAALEKARR
jgi:hypothetical protein